MQLAIVTFIFAVANITLNSKDISAGNRFFGDLFTHGESPQYFPRIVICQMKVNRDDF